MGVILLVHYCILILHPPGGLESCGVILVTGFKDPAPFLSRVHPKLSEPRGYTSRGVVDKCLVKPPVLLGRVIKKIIYQIAFVMD